ncbi:MAG: VWA domain-containing protein [Silvibacterium sp.]|nr:VWA domain-containing protein [Silvibacterium sp.]MBV8437879.1 VWA domain-containing protein [Silvibacterium sp.]
MKRFAVALCCFSTLFFVGRARTAGQEDSSSIRVNVVLVQLNVAVTDGKGNYISGLHPENFSISEDKIPEKLATFEEGGEPVQRLLQGPGSPVQTVSVPTGSVPTGTPSQPSVQDANDVAPATRLSGANVFILFDTSNYMYRGFVYAQDAIADFVRSLEGVNKVAFYSYSRDLSRATALTADRSKVLLGVRNTVAGDNAALYNCLLLTVKDAAPLKGKKAIVVFSNGPDDASSVPPEDVTELAQSTGTIIYMISTQQAQTDPISEAVFERVSKATGGKAYFARNWRDEKKAFGSIREDLAHLYALSYYPAANPNHGWRTISVKLVGKDVQRYRVRTRDGYRLLQTAQVTSASNANPGAESAPE